MAKFVDPQDASREGWSFPEPPTPEVLQLGALLRIAKALENIEGMMLVDRAHRKKADIAKDHARQDAWRAAFIKRFGPCPPPPTQLAYNRVFRGLAYNGRASPDDVANLPPEQLVALASDGVRSIGPITRDRFIEWAINNGL